MMTLKEHSPKITVRPPAILVGGGIIALSVARSLGRAGIRVSSLDSAKSETAYSKFCTRLAVDDTLGSKGWLQWLLGEGTKTHHGAILLPCSDEGLELLVRNRSALAEHYIVMEANDEMIFAMLDKARTYAIAAEIGVPAPNVFQIDTEADLRKIQDTILFPCALKPRSSHDFVKHFPTLKMFIVQNIDELVDAFRRVQPFGLQMILTELIPPGAEGYHSYYSYFDETGTPLFHFTKRKLRQFPNAFGLGTYHVTDWNPEVAELGLKFFKGAGLRGMGNVEFMRDPRDGKLKLIECNARFTLTTELVRASGFDMALLAYNRMAGLPLPALRKYRQGIYAIRPMSDFLAFLEARRAGTMTLASYVKSILHVQHVLVFSWSDPMPALVRFPPFLGKQLERVLALLPLPHRAKFVSSLPTTSAKKGAV